MGNYPKYRIKSVLNDEYEYIHQPQIKEFEIFGWYNLVGQPTKGNIDIASVDDISHTHVSRTRFDVKYWSTKLGAQMVIKFHHLKLKREEKLAKENKGKKKVIYTNINPDEL